MPIINQTEIETHRAGWADVARQHGWYTEPFHVIVWLDEQTGEVLDSVSHRGLDRDVIAYADPEDYED